MLAYKFKKGSISTLGSIFYSLASGAIITLSFSPFDQWFFGILGCLFFLLILNQSFEKNAFWIGWLFGIGLFVSGASWISVSIDLYGGASTLLAWTLTLFFCFGLGLFYAFFSYIYVKWLHNNAIGSILGFPALWTTFEWLRSWVFSGFPWLYLGYAHLETPLSGYAPIVSVFGVSFLCALSASLLFSLICSRSGTAKMRSAFCLIFVWALGLALKNIEWTSPKIEEPLDLAIYQPNIPQDKKWDWRYKEKIKTQLSERIMPLIGKDLIILPEATIPDYYKNSIDLLTPMAKKAKELGSTLVIGIPTFNIETKNSYNSVLSLGIGEGTYNKRRLVPFGEYVPFENHLRGLIEFFDLPMSNFLSGQKVQPFLTAKNTLIAPFICYEVAYPDLVLKEAKGADILVTLSNDTWFGNSIGPHQHLQIARMRALETGRYVLRATNNGISAIITHKGALLSKTSQFREELLYGKIYATQGSTPASSIGILSTLSISFAILFFLFLKKYLTRRKSEILI